MKVLNSPIPTPVNLPMTGGVTDALFLFVSGFMTLMMVLLTTHLRRRKTEVR